MALITREQDTMDNRDEVPSQAVSVPACCDPAGRIGCPLQIELA